MIVKQMPVLVPVPGLSEVRFLMANAQYMTPTYMNHH
jgi:hypothetical protein